MIMLFKKRQSSVLRLWNCRLFGRAVRVLYDPALPIINCWEALMARGRENDSGSKDSSSSSNDSCSSWSSCRVHCFSRFVFFLFLLLLPFPNWLGLRMQSRYYSLLFAFFSTISEAIQSARAALKWEKDWNGWNCARDQILRHGSQAKRFCNLFIRGAERLQMLHK